MDSIVRDDVETVVIPVAEFRDHMEKVNLLMGILSGLINAMSANPMMAAFIPAELKDRIRQFDGA